MPIFKVVCIDTAISDFQIEKDIFGKIGADVVVLNTSDEKTIIENCKDAHAIMVNQPKITKNIIDNIPLCKVITRYGIGVDSVDVEYATTKGIFVTNTPGYCVEEVSDVAIMLILMLLRKALIAHQRALDDIWTLKGIEDIDSIENKTVGVLGFGGIGKSFARKVRAFNPKKILVLSRFTKKEDADKLGVVLSDLNTILKESDIISIHLPMTPENSRIINKNTLALMKPTAILVNTGRGKLLNESDVIDALNNKTIAGVGLDVFEEEPFNTNHSFKKMSNVVLSPHLSWYSVSSLKKMKTMSATDVSRILNNEMPFFPVNKLL